MTLGLLVPALSFIAALGITIISLVRKEPLTNRDRLNLTLYWSLPVLLYVMFNIVTDFGKTPVALG